ncbi:MAG TPA: cation:proton antiporter [Terracidiphilus sp.]|nr:cation:proton antiporter [Terracidiphilus sp.]
MTVLEILAILFATAAVFGLVSARWLRLPTTIGTMLLAVLLAVLLTQTAGRIPAAQHAALDLLRQIDFGAVILHGMLPLLLFAGAFLLDLDLLRREKFTVTLLATAGTVLSFFFVSGLMSLLSGGRIPWIQCLIFGALVSPTDPIAVLEMLGRSNVPGRIQAQLAGESLFNDGVGAVLFLTMLGIATGATPTPASVAGSLILQSGGGILVGIVCAWITSHLMRRLDENHLVDILFTVALALGGYVIASLLNLSAPLEAVVAGIALRQFNSSVAPHRIAHENLDRFWRIIDEIQNSVLFVLMGFVSLSIALDAAIWRAGISAILSVNLVRFACVALLLAVIRLVQPAHRSSALILGWGGLRGGLSLALALSVPQALGRSWMLGATYILVVFSIVVQGTSMGWLLRRASHRSTAA